MKTYSLSWMLPSRLLHRQHYYGQAVITGLIAFGVYFCMYAFRKPFTVGQYQDLTFWGMDYKILLIVCQVLGYATSKFLGIRIISGLHPGRRAWGIVGCMGFAGLTLLAFALVPPPYNLICMYLNGLPLGLIWGFAFSYLEGRQSTEIMAAMLSSSFILATGMVKSAGVWMMQHFGISEFWMPVATGSLFFLPLLFLVWLLNKTKPPTSEDIQQRNAREPMTPFDRKKLFLTLAPGLTVFILLYMLVTAFRDFRDNFAVEVWAELGVKNNAAIFTQTEIPVTLSILILFAGFFLVRDNYKAFRGLSWMILAGLVIIGINNLAFEMGLIQSPVWWTILTGIGLYLAYFPYNSMLFERLMAAHRGKGNAGFLIYLADAFGYLGSILILFLKAFFHTELDYLHFFMRIGYTLSATGILAILFVHFYFRKKLGNGTPGESVSPTY